MKFSTAVQKPVEKIGHRRVYPPGIKPDLYPGEVANAEVVLSAEEIEVHRRAGYPIEMDLIRAHVTVEPMPGFYGWFLRTRYRLLRGASALLAFAVLLQVIAVAFAVARLSGWSSIDLRVSSVLSYIGFGITLGHVIAERVKRRKHGRRSWQI